MAASEPGAWVHNEEGGFLAMNDASDEVTGCMSIRSETLKEKKAKITEKEAEVAVEEMRLQKKKSALEKAKVEMKKEEAKVEKKKSGTLKKAKDGKKCLKTKAKKRAGVKKEEEKFVVSWSIIEEGKV
jgi:hypothetical protein